MKTKKSKFKKQFTTVTSVSKILAAVIFIALPFIGFYLGVQYQESMQENDTVPISLLTK